MHINIKNNNNNTRVYNACYLASSKQEVAGKKLVVMMATSNHGFLLVGCGRAVVVRECVRMPSVVV
jgi:hypothetical protein